jgi:acyl carrier protein
MRADTPAGVVRRLMAIVGREVELPAPPDAADTGPGSISRLGLSSAGLLAVLVAVEDEFGFEWDDDVPPEVFGSFDEMAAHIAARAADA